MSFEFQTNILDKNQKIDQTQCENVCNINFNLHPDFLDVSIRNGCQIIVQGNAVNFSKLLLELKNLVFQ